MEPKKVPLPRKVVDALKDIKAEKGNLDCYILWRASRPESAEDENTNWNVLYEFVNTVGDNIFLLADALRYGYEPEPEPITIVITPEMQEQIKTWYEAHQEDADRHYRIGFVTALGLCGIKISGVNE